jgi:hypothetical protein
MSSLSPSRALGVVYRKTNTQVTYRLGFGRSLYSWKQNFIELPISVPPQNSLWVVENRRNKCTYRICHAAATPSFGLWSVYYVRVH